MADTPRFEVPQQLRTLAESSVDQARTAFDGFMGVAKRGAAAVQGAGGPMTPGADMYARGLDLAEQNIHAAFEHAQKLARAGSMQEAMQLQVEYGRTQFAAMQDQAKEFTGMAQGALQRGADQARSAVQQGTDEARKMADRAQDAVQQH